MLEVFVNFEISLLFPGIRLLRQPPLECLYSFICSTNNNIPRITKMLKVLKVTTLTSRSFEESGNEVAFESRYIFHFIVLHF